MAGLERTHVQWGERGRRIRWGLVTTMVVALMGGGSLPVAWADEDHGHDRRRAAAPANAKYQRECAACHMAYPPGLLPASSWRAINANLSNHFGSEASLDAATVGQLTQWLVRYAGTGPRAPQDRITRMSWFVHEHDEVGASVWRRAAIKTPGNCIACHRGAEQDQFNEREIRIPR